MSDDNTDPDELIDAFRRDYAEEVQAMDETQFVQEFGKRLKTVLPSATPDGLKRELNRLTGIWVNVVKQFKEKPTSDRKRPFYNLLRQMVLLEHRIKQRRDVSSNWKANVSGRGCFSILH